MAHGLLPPCRPMTDAVVGSHKLSNTSGAETHMGVRLQSVFVAAELPPPIMQLRAVIRAGSGRLEVVHLVTDLVETLLPAMERLGIATAAQVNLANLADRIMTESQSDNAIIETRRGGAPDTPFLMSNPR